MTDVKEMLKARMANMLSNSPVAKISDDTDVRQWLFLGRIAMFFLLWMLFIIPILLIIDLRF